VDVRVIAATNRNLEQMVEEGTFRQDLYFRLNVIALELPPLRDRREDIEPLARHLLSRVSRRHDRAVRLAPDAMRAILRYHWPGNVRELENALEYAVAVSRGQTLHAQDLPLEVTGGEPDLHEISASSTTDTEPSQEAAVHSPASELERIRNALDTHQWRRTEAAAELGMSRTTLWRKMREYGL